MPRPPTAAARIGDPPPADRESVVRGHQRILAALHEFGPGSGRSHDACDRDAAHALSAFLRQEILPFARREEHLLAPGSAEYEATTFEHAFLAAEIDALTRAVDRWDAGPSDAHGCARDVLRTIHRVEAILELHAARHTERWLERADQGADPAPLTRSGAGSSPAGSVRSLADPEIFAVLMRHWWAVLSTAARGRPYAVPVAFGMDGRNLYVASRNGMKVRAVETNPAVCLTVTEVASGADWTSVVVTGTAEWVTGPLETLRAMRALQRQCGRRLATTQADAARLAGARVMRIVPAELTGRRREPE
jgi:nitroimidazol reductase NimA-like FMN-containing flavoprotein (pyridoxamine 5'-phosphate oxidase superfamily)